MNRWLDAWSVMRCLGPRWLLFRGAYAVRQRCGWDAWRLPVSTWDAVPLAGILRSGISVEPTAYKEFRRRSAVRFFFPSKPSAVCRSVFTAWDAGDDEVQRNAARIGAGDFPFFEHVWIPCGRPPDWHRNPFTGQKAPALGHWSRLDEFGSGDIKLVWELNRFGFVFALVRAYWRTRDESLAECFWQLVEDWRAHNPPQAGINWKCGQEASFRLMAWCFGLYGFGDAEASSPARVARLGQMMFVTGRRIASNLSYALSQRNNHGISEAAGLWTLGTLFPEFRVAARWQKAGRAALESQARELIYDDGGFSQHSVNYHRVMLELCLWCIQLGRINDEEFTPEFSQRVRQAGQWLKSQMDPETGHLPNWGSNDGAHVLPLSSCGYLDYRPVVQAAAMIMEGKTVLPPGRWDEQAWWLGCPVAHQALSEGMAQNTETQAGSETSLDVLRQDFPMSGLSLLQQGTTRIVLRTLRRFRHRPAQCDLLHLDLWSGSSNVLRDSGAYSYNAPNGADRYFKSVAAHNTIQFDGHEQMPVLGRFLYGRWPRGEVWLPAEDPTKVAAGHVDWHGCKHERMVKLVPGCCSVSDRLSGFRREAVLRWHLSPEVAWNLSDSTCFSSLAIIHVSATGIRSAQLHEEWESLFYNAKRPIPVFEITVGANCSKIETEILLVQESPSPASSRRISDFAPRGSGL